MASVTEVRLAFGSPESGGEVGELIITCRRGESDWKGIPLLIDARGLPTDESTAPVQLLEESEYHYRILGADAAAARLEPTELFDADPSGLTGRVKPGRYTGTVSIGLHSDNNELIGSAELEVRARKLDYLTEYRWMLGRVSEEATELLLQHFSASGLKALRPSLDGPPKTFYQRFAFIQSMLSSPEFDDAVQIIRNRPHTAFLTITEAVHPSKGLRADRQVVRAITGAGPRTVAAEGRLPRGLESLPEKMTRVSHTEIADTVPNRFIKFAFEHWRALADAIADRLADPQPEEAGSDTAARRRGLREAEALSDQIELMLNAPLFRTVSRLDHFPEANQVLQRREGYRHIFRLFLQVEAAASLDWSGGEDVFSAGQRNVATLYEYWVFLEVARIVGSVPAANLSLKSLLEISKDKLTLGLKQGSQRALTGTATRHGTELSLELWFNKTFGPKTGSWTESMRPDVSLRITPHGRFDVSDSTWIHFDAKYRVKHYREVLGEGSDAEDEEAESPASRSGLAPVPQDLLKMHAYRDAITRSSGAYVLYPGDDDASPSHLRERYHEIVPGLGAFVLRPTPSGEASGSGAAAVKDFIENILNHVASQGTSEQRADYWETESYRGLAGQTPIQLPSAAVLRKPPADTSVLLGFVRSTEHLAWIKATHLYNLRADGRSGSVQVGSPELGAEFVVLYGRHLPEPVLYSTTDRVVIKTAAQLTGSGYPGPRGDLYLCLDLGSHLEPEDYPPLETPDIERILKQKGEARVSGAPVATDWATLFGGPPDVSPLPTTSYRRIHDTPEGC